MPPAAEHGDAEADIAGEEDRQGFGRFPDQGFFFRGVAGGADDQGHGIFLRIGDYIGGGGMVGEIDEHVGIHPAQLGKGSGGSVFAVNADLTHDFLTQDAADQLAHGAVGAANNGSHTLTPSFLICS